MREPGALNAGRDVDLLQSGHDFIIRLLYFRGESFLSGVISKAAAISKAALMRLWQQLPQLFM